MKTTTFGRARAAFLLRNGFADTGMYRYYYTGAAYNYRKEIYRVPLSDVLGFTVTPPERVRVKLNMTRR